MEEKFLLNRIKRLSEENMIRNVEIIMLDTITEYVDSADISLNKVRSKAVHGKRNVGMVLERSSNSIMNKYRVQGDTKSV